MSKSEAAKILFLEDDEMIASGLVYALEQEGYDICHCDKVACAIACVTDEAEKGRHFDLAILDMQLPDGIGMQVHETLKELGTKTAVIYLSVVDDEGNIVKAFEGGAADYVTKPFRLRELLARISRTLAAKSATGKGIENIVRGDVTIDPTAGKVYARGNLIELTVLEHRLLLALINSNGKTLTRAQIIDSIWDDYGGFVEDNTLTVYIRRLRGKLKGALEIETVRGVGYRVNQ